MSQATARTAERCSSNARYREISAVLRRIAKTREQKKYKSVDHLVNICELFDSKAQDVKTDASDRISKA